MVEFNSNIVTPSLKQLVKILNNNNVKYRFLGSVVISAINGKQYRNLGDLDLIVDIKGKDILYTQLINLGYKRAGGIFAFARRYLFLETLEHEKLIGVGYFVGRWQKDGSIIMGEKLIKVSIESYALKSTQYELYGIEFIGIPQQSIATGVKSSENNPKRKKEILILKEKNILPFTNNYIHIDIFGIKSDWIYHFTMKILNIVGVLRVKLGLPFDPWR